MLKEAAYAATEAAERIVRRGAPMGDDINAELMADVIRKNPEFKKLDSILAAIAHVCLNGHTEQGARVIGVCSAFKGEGKTTTSVALATSLALRGGVDVLLIEADLETPSLAHDLRRDNGPGLVECLQGEAGDAAVIRRTPIPRLSIMTAGRPTATPLPLLAQPGLRQLITGMRSRYAYVILDMPAVLERAETALLLELVDKAILVIQAGRASPGVAEEAVATIGREKLMGVVLNRSHSSAPRWLSRIMSQETPPPAA
jgi:capsular exopolysaccharide synthesis family protein